MKKALLIVPPICIILAIVFKLFTTASKQRVEFEYHDSIPKTIELASTSFENNGMIPTAFSAKGGNVSPELHWSNIPQETKSFVVLMTDYDGPAPFLKLSTVSHWVVYNIPAGMHELEEGIDSLILEGAEIQLGINYTKNGVYAGPKPPMGVHRYFFRIYALSVPSLKFTHLQKQEVMDAMKGNVLAYGELIGKY